MEKLFNKIFNSDGFIDQKHYQDLLRYLVVCSLNNESPKETSIAIEIFGKNTDYDPTTDSTVRVYVHNLRKKLQTYYLKQGKNDCIKFSIPKGHYKVEFEENNHKSPIYRKLIIGSAISLLVLILGIFIGTIFKSNNNTISKKDIIWGDIINNNKTTTLVLGDHYFFKGYYKEKIWNIRDIRINNDQELEEFIENDESQLVNFKKYEKSYLPTRIPWCTANLVSVFNAYALKYKIQISSQFEWDDINNNNVIYAGSFRALGILENLLMDRFNFNMPDHGILVLGDSSQVEQKFFASKSENYPIIDYALVVKQPGPKNSTMLFFVSTHDIGAIQVTRMLTDMNSLKNFESEYLDNKIKYFQAIFEVKGYSHSSMEHRLVYFKKINND